jgi:hypothetical protein
MRSGPWRSRAGAPAPEIDDRHDNSRSQLLAGDEGGVAQRRERWVRIEPNADHEQSRGVDGPRGAPGAASAAILPPSSAQRELLRGADPRAVRRRSRTPAQIIRCMLWRTPDDADELILDAAPGGTVAGPAGGARKQPGTERLKTGRAARAESRREIEQAEAAQKAAEEKQERRAEGGALAGTRPSFSVGKVEAQEAKVRLSRRMRA